ncbi:MAG: permease [Bacteroidota bacterium]|nr:permease [Bacteroidota bacterium]MDX5446849.1 permease [Bacteroidota bacterium]
MNEIFDAWGEIAYTSLGFFWKSLWAFILGYGVSGAIQAFVPKKNLTRIMGGKGFQSVGLSTFFGAISSSCSFAALATARSLFSKGASFVATVAFMFASTNLVIELGILIFIFLGPQYVWAEIIGGLVLILISSLLIRLFHPHSLIQRAREHVKKMEGEEEDFDWRSRISSIKGWQMAGMKFVHEWKMAWEDITIGFTIAGLVSVLVPDQVWEWIFLQGVADPESFLVRLENALVAPFVAAMTFIGSMGNIPLATVLAGSGVAFAGVLGFIYSDLMVPPLVNMNRKYYGTKVAFFIAGIMYVSIVLTALIMNYSFEWLDIVPEHIRKIEEVTRVKIDYTFWMNLSFLLVSAVLVWGHRLYLKRIDSMPDMDMGGDSKVKRWIVYSFLTFIVIGLILHLIR